MRRMLSIPAVLLVTIAAISPANAGASSANIEFVASIPYAEATHLEFMTRRIDTNGDGILEDRAYAMTGSRGGAAPGLRIIDVTDPETPVVTAVIPCAQSPADVAVTEFAGRWYALLGNGSASGCRIGTARGKTVFIADVTDPSSPIPIGWPSTASASKGAHTIVAYPGRAIIYVASQALPDRTPTIEILNLEVSPPTVTVAPMPQTGVGPHDITFNPSGTRAFVSSINATFIIDSTDPLAPVTTPPIAVIVDPEIKIHHEAVLHPNGRHLLVVDETVAAPPAGTPVCPGGGVTVFDLGPGATLERAPVKVGRFYADDTSAPVLEDTHGTPLDPSCTAHEFNISADGSWMPIGWMGAGVRTFDLSALVAATSSPVPVPVTVPELGHYKVSQIDVWAAKVHPLTGMYIFVSDTSQEPTGGFHVLKRTA